MEVFNSTKFINTYGIDDTDFFTFIRSYNNTFTVLVRYYDINLISKKDMQTVYNRYIYYKSIGLDLSSINNELNNEYKTIISKLNGKLIKITKVEVDYIGITNFSMVFTGDFVTISLEGTVKQNITSNLPYIRNVPPSAYDNNDLFIPNSIGNSTSCEIRINNAGDILLWSGVPAGRLRATLTYKYK